MESTLGNRYEILDLVGEGGMAEVYKARHIQLNRLVAIKVMHRFLARDLGFKARFEREATLGARLRHPNIVEVFDYGAQEDKKIYYIVVEYIDGPSLAKHLDNLTSNNERMPADEFLRVSRDVASALSYAHSQGMIHRDVKASNVLLEYGYRVVLTDFGMAKMITHTPTSSDQLTASNTMVGTPAYMSPEQALGESGDGSSDIYSLGVLMYQMATGQLPFSSDSPVALALKQVNEMPVEPSEVDPYIPSQINNIIMRCLMKDPGARYQRANDLVDDLEAVAISEVLRPNAGTQVLRHNAITDAPLERLEPRKSAKLSSTATNKTVSLKTTPPMTTPRRLNHSVLVGFSVLIPLLVLGTLLSKGSSVLKLGAIVPTQLTAVQPEAVQLENRVSTTVYESTQIAAQIHDAVQATQGASNSTQIAVISTRGAQNATLLAGYATELAPTAIYLANQNNREKSAIASATLIPCSAAAATNTGANVRTGPGLNYYAFGMLGINSSVPVLGYVDEPSNKTRWWQVNFKTKAGWVVDSEVLLSGNCNGFPAPLKVPPTQVLGKPPYTLVPANTATPTNTVAPPSTSANTNKSSSPQPTSVSPTNTPISPTQTSVPPTNTLVPPTNTLVPPTNTLVPPTNTPDPPTNPPPTAVPPTDIPPTDPPPTSPPPTDPPPTDVPPTDVPPTP